MLFAMTYAEQLQYCSTSAVSSPLLSALKKLLLSELNHNEAAV